MNRRSLLSALVGIGLIVNTIAVCTSTIPTDNSQLNAVSIAFYSNPSRGQMGDACPASCDTPVMTQWYYIADSSNPCLQWPGSSGENSMKNGVCSPSSLKYTYSQWITCDCSGSPVVKDSYTNQCLIDNPTTLCSLVVDYSACSSACGEPAQTGYIFAPGSLTTGSYRTASCASGYQGTATSILCSSGLWSNSDGCAIISDGCNEAPVQSGYVFEVGSSTYGSTRAASCSTNFAGTPTSITCLNTGFWSTASGCSYQGCVNSPTQAGYIFTISDNTFGAVSIGQQCDVGYIGTPSPIECTSNGDWTSSSGCDIVSCPIPSAIGYIISAGTLTYGSTRTVSCVTGYSGNPFTIVCQADGTWTTLSSCEVVICPTPSQTNYVIANGNFNYGSTRTVTCATGYTGTATSISCLASGAWSLSTGCTIVDCSTPPSEYGYDVSSGATTFGASRLVQCATGYSGSASSIACQSNGVWSAFSGCVLVSCGSPVAVEGYVIGFGNSTYSSSRGVSCASAFTGTAPSIVCQANATWTSFFGCTIVSCSASPIQPVGYAVSNGSNLYGDVRNVYCSSGYSGTPSSISCQLDGTWTTSSGCAPSACSTWPSQVGYAIGSGLSSFGSTREVTCASSYVGVATPITCLTSGSWTSASGCSLITCDSSPSSVGYVIMPGGSSFGDMRAVQCAAGYSGSPSSIMCQLNGMWTLPSGCSSAGCVTPVATAGYIIAPGGSTFGATRSVTCALGFYGSTLPISCSAAGVSVVSFFCCRRLSHYYGASLRIAFIFASFFLICSVF
jgi:hypothetical protein